MSRTTIIILVVIVLAIIASAIFLMSIKNEGKTGFRIMIVGEKGQEYIIPNWMMEREDVQRIVESLEQVRTYN